MQMYGNFQGFALQECIVWVGNIMTPEPPPQKVEVIVFFCWIFAILFQVGERLQFWRLTQIDHIVNRTEVVAF